MKYAAVLILVSFMSLGVALITDPIESRYFDVAGCTKSKKIITDSVLRTVVAFFADNPRDNKPFVPGQIIPFTPSGIFEDYYGKNASAHTLSSAILNLVLKDRNDKGLKVDRGIQRSNLHAYIKALSFEYARQKAAVLFQGIIEDFAESGHEYCINNERVYDVDKALQVELAKIRNEVGDGLFGQFLDLNVGSSLAFVIDTTGSMSGEIEAAKKRAKEIVNLRHGSLDAPQNFVLVPFNDPKVGPVTKTRDAAQFKSALARLRAQGGGDAPEMAMQGIQLAVENSRPGSVLYVITDMHAKDYKIQDSVLAEAQRKSIQVTFLLTNDNINDHCSGYRRRIDNEYLQCQHLYDHIATSTGGKTLVIHKSAIFDSTKIVEQSVQQGIVDVVHYNISSQSSDLGETSITFPVSPLEHQITIEASGDCDVPHLQSIAQDKGVVKMDGERTIGKVLISHVSVNKIGYGEFQYRFGTSSNCDVKVSARSRISFIMTLYRSSKNSNKHFLLENHPSSEDALRISLDAVGTELFPDVNIKTVQLVAYHNGEILKQIHVSKHEVFGKDAIAVDLEAGAIKEYSSFKVQVVGEIKENEKQYKFVRTMPKQIRVSPLKIKADFSSLQFQPPEVAHTNISIYNDGEEDTFILTTSDSLGLSGLGHDKDKSMRVNIAKGENKVVLIYFNTATKLSTGRATTITITANGLKTKVFQYASSELVVVEKKKPKVQSLAIESTINARLAETVITFLVTNDADVGREAEFDIMLPQEAFITELHMILENETIIGKVEEKKKAKRIYEAAKTTGVVAGHVAARDRSTRVFKQSVFVEPQKNVTFVLKYQEMLKRTLGEYEYAVVINPHQAVKRMSVKVHIVEESPLGFVRVPAIRTDQTYNKDYDADLEGVTIEYGHNGKSADIIYSPTLNQQTENSPLGISGSFIVKYDVTRSSMHGQVSMENGYFVHFFAPPEIPPAPKIVIFVLDSSGSMYGTKMSQMQEAMLQVLDGLNEGDRFNLVLFGDTPKPWINDVMATGTGVSISDAKSFVKLATPNGGTDLLAAIKSALELLEPYLPEKEGTVAKIILKGSGDLELGGSGTMPSSTAATTTDSVIYMDDEDLLKSITKRAAIMDSDLENYAKMIVLLTDGKPSIGETDPDEIIERITSVNEGRFNLHTVGFGSQADMDLLEELAEKNMGASRRIFEGLNAGTQIRNFFTEVTNPVLRDVSIEYPSPRVEHVTVNCFDNFLQGSEIAVAGHIKEDVKVNLEDDFELDILDESDFKGPNMIPARVMGKSFENDITMDFEFDVRKPSPISTARHKIKNFTERLWAFLRVKELLLKAKLEKDKETKAYTNDLALNMSLKYNFVTPLTSLVVLRDKDREDIETKLTTELEDAKNREEEKRKQEEEARKREEESRKRGEEFGVHAHEEDISEDLISSFPEGALEYSYYGGRLMDIEMGPGHTADYLTYGEGSHGEGLPRMSFAPHPAGPRPPPRKKSKERSRGGGRGGGGGGGFSGDPHFLLPIQENLNLCFNWDGIEGEVFNFITDPDRELVVNAVLANAVAPKTSRRRRRTYVAQLSIMLPQLRVSCLITPRNVTLVQKGATNLTIPLESRVSIRRNGFVFMVEDVNKHNTTVTVEVGYISFTVTLHKVLNKPHIVDHMDFALDGSLSELSSRSTGILGQFASWAHGPEKLKFFTDKRNPQEGDKGHLLVNDNIVPIKKNEVLNPSTHELVGCWYLQSGARDLTQLRRTSFQRNHIFEIVK